MAGSSSNSSSIVEIREEYPYPSHISTPSLSVKLSERGKYNLWKTQMIYFLTGHDMLGFINGKFVSPKGNGKAKMEDMEAWIRSDALAVSWILSTLSEEVSMYVVNRLTSMNPNVVFTAKDVWNQLELIYGPKILQQATGSSSNSSSIVEFREECPYPSGSSSNSSSIAETREEYPYPSHISTQSLFSVKLSDRGKYNVWKTQMIYFLRNHDMLEFVSPKGDGKAKMEAWMRSDALVVSWILGTLSEEVTMYVVKRLTSKNPNVDFTVDFTAKDVWDELECIYGPKILQQAGETEKTTRRKTEAKNKLYEYVVKQRMDLVNALLDGEEVTVTDKITSNGNTALHVAVGTSKNLNFFKKLLEKTPEDINLTDLKNSDGSTLLHMAGTVGNIDAAEMLMEKYPGMLYKTDKEGQTPLVVALSNTHTNFYWSLLELKIKRKLFIYDARTVFTEEVLKLAISHENFYEAWSMIWCELRDQLNTDAVLMALAQKYPCKLSFWERRVAEFEDTPIANVFLELPFVKRRLKFRHQAFQVLLSVCKLIQIEISSDRHKDYYNNPILEATRLNVLDVVKVLVYHFPDAFWSASEDGHNVIQHAVINRSEKIYNLLYHMTEHKNVYKTIKDASGNNLLHLAARLAPSEKLNRISGAALQIQYELKWYKEVEEFVCPLNKTEKNSFEETPQMVFTRTHKALVSNGEKWMRSTAESYTITAALITTIVFAAAITVPGGNNQDTGVPIFTDNPAFTIFAVSDAISLFTAVMSLLMFLSILTARFSEKDFLYKLPSRLIIGLVTLFISTTTMIIAFGAALFIVFGQNNGSLLIPIGAFTGVTIAFFVALQSPLVYDLMRATYGRKIFGKRNATSNKCLQKYINKMTCQPIVDDKKEKREIMMPIDWHRTGGGSRYNLVNCDDIPFNI